MKFAILSTVILAYSTFTVTSAFSAEVLKKGVHYCQNNTPAVKISSGEIYCRESVFSNASIKDGLKPGQVYGCKNARVLLDKSQSKGETYISFTGKVKCN
jgi:hypothetical protein